MNRELNEHLQELSRWIEQLGDTPKQTPGLSVEEQKQLQAVNKAVEQLKRLGVSVPEDLRRLKLRFSAKDVTDLEKRETQDRLAELEALIKQLGKILNAARSLRDQLKTTGQPGGTKKHYGISLLDLFQGGQLSAEDRFELQWLKDGPRHEGKVKSDGTVMVKATDGWKPYTSLSTAASQISGRSLNGWKHWRRINSDGSSTALEEIRRLYLNKGAGR